MPHFYHLLQPIPNPIAQLLAKGRGETATLFSPLGKFWHITLQRDVDDSMYFDSGWREFSQAHNLVAGCFVVFRYEGNMVFKVKVFDTSGCRKQYEKIAHGIVEEISVDSKDEEPDEVLIIDDQQNLSTCSRKRRKSARLNSKSSAQQQGNGELRTPPVFRSKNKSVEKSNNSGDYPPHFEKIIRPYNFSCFRMSVPKEFCASHGLLRKEVMTLKDPKQRLWPVKLWQGKRQIRFSKGWMDFSMGNKLEDGDKCIFQLVSSEVMQVIIQKRRA
ncbi:putative B3 domain-containing protein [Ananas comosus]|uniref:Putative B3 domain-containing protein n=1 Tax=Ananas comosus TaxID=4615 RepID=A0A199VSW6_ANACO|nr:putative B3 domain-containing protein [Ananas comosus]